MIEPQKVVLIPGLLETHFAMWSLRRSLSRHCEHTEYWRDRVLFRNVQASVDRLADVIQGDVDQHGPIGIVTHSFGDWIARAAIAQSTRHRVTALVSIAPVMRAGLLPTIGYALTGNLAPEIEIIKNRDKASANLDCDSRVRRLVIWAHVDESLRQVPLDKIRNLEVKRIWGTHLSIIWQPNTLRLVSDFLFASTTIR